MSIEALNWAFKQDSIPSSVKFVLVALADNANDNLESYPSVETISRKTCQDRKTVLLALRKLEYSDRISDTGKRMGVTNQVKVFKLRTQTESIPKAAPLGKSPKNGSKQSRFSVETVPKTGHRTIRESSEEPSDIFFELDPNEEPTLDDLPPPAPPLILQSAPPPKKRPAPAKSYLPPLPKELSSIQDAWEEWIQHRKEKGNKVTPLGATKQIKLLGKLGPARARQSIEESIANGWSGLFEPKETQRRNGTPSNTHIPGINL